MASKIFLASLSLFFLIVLNGGLAERQQRERQTSIQNQCQFDQLDALEPQNRIEAEAGVTEVWDNTHQQFQCAGVAIIRRRLERNALLLPSFTNVPQLVYIVRGRGYFSVVFPGCPETFQESQESQQGGRRQQRGERQSFEDQHQKIRHFRQGDVVALPAGVTYWFYNSGEEPLVFVTLLDTSNVNNQLDQNPRKFFLAGNPEQEFQQQGEQRGSRERHERRGERSECNNIFCGFDEELLAEAFNVDSELIRRLQNEEDNRGNIIRVEGGLQVTQPPRRRQGGEEGGESEREGERGQRQHGREPEWEREREGERRQHGRHEEESERERERERERGQRQHGRREGESERERERERKRGQRQHGRREGESEWERERESERGQRQHGRHEQQPEWERERERERGQGRERRRGEGSCDNGLEETFCSLKLRENIGDPSRADVFTPRAGRVSSINSHNLPVLNWLQLSAERGVLYRNAIFVPHWNLNAHSIMYVTRGRARVQVVDHNGNSVFDDEIQEGQVLTIPQNFAVLKRAGDEGFEWVSFKTNDNAMINPLVGRTSAIRGIPGDVLRNAFKDLSDEDVQRLKNNRRETSLLSPSGRSERMIATA